MNGQRRRIPPVILPGGSPGWRHPAAAGRWTLLAEKVHDACVGENPEVRAQPALALVVAVLAAFEENGDGVGHGVLDEA